MSAANNIAFIYILGNGVSADYNKAYSHFYEASLQGNDAASKGHYKAIELLKKIKSKDAPEKIDSVFTIELLDQ